MKKVSGDKKCSNRYISAEIKNLLMVEAGFRCSIPACRAVPDKEMAHIIPVSEKEDNTLANLIVLCPNCHTAYDRRSKKGHSDWQNARKQMKQVKMNLMLLNGRYSPFELRLLHYFASDVRLKEIILFGRELDVYYLTKDGLLQEGSERYQNSINFPPKKYFLTDFGKKYISILNDGESLEKIESYKLELIRKFPTSLKA